MSSFGPNTTTYSGTTTYAPSYGIVGWVPQVGRRRVYTKSVILDIWDITGQELVKIYESTIANKGLSDIISDIIDEMITALFLDFQAAGVREEYIKETKN